MFDDADFQLVWPPELFIREATRLLRRPSADEGDIRLLLEEAFAGQTPIDRFNAKPSAAALQRMKPASTWRLPTRIPPSGTPS